MTPLKRSWGTPFIPPFTKYEGEVELGVGIVSAERSLRDIWVKKWGHTPEDIIVN